MLFLFTDIDECDPSTPEGGNNDCDTNAHEVCVNKPAGKETSNYGHQFGQNQYPHVGILLFQMDGFYVYM